MNGKDMKGAMFKDIRAARKDFYNDKSAHITGHLLLLSQEYIVCMFKALLY